MPAQDTTFLTTIFPICRLGELWWRSKLWLANLIKTQIFFSVQYLSSDFGWRPSKHPGVSKNVFLLAPLEIFSKRFFQPAPWKCIIQFLSQIFGWQHSFEMDFSVPLQEVPRSSPLGVLIKNASKIVGQPFIFVLKIFPMCIPDNFSLYMHGLRVN